MERSQTRTLLAAAAAAAVLAGALGAGAAAPASFAVLIQGSAYHPTPLVVHVGDTVVWTNLDATQHTVTSLALDWSSDYLNEGQAFERTFALPGVVPYRCLPHAWMQGQVVVLP